MSNAKKNLMTRGIQLGAIAIIFMVLGVVIGQKTSLLTQSSNARSTSQIETCTDHGVDKDICFICDPALREERRLWCEEHGRYEDRCWLCQPALEDKGRPFCEEHGLYEDECLLCRAPTATMTCAAHDIDKRLCFICDPDLREAGRLWCKEHDRYEDRCWLCHPEFEDKNRPWCKEHLVYEDECTICRASSSAGADACADEASGSKSLSELEGAKCEHGVPIVDCDNCRFEVGVVKIDPSVAESLLETDLAEEVQRGAALSFTGQVQVDRTKTVEVPPTGAGQVRQVFKFLGDKVEKGETLAVIHSTEFGKAKADYLEIQAQLELAREAFKREKELYEKKVSSKADYLSASNELKSRQALIAAADKRLRFYGLDSHEIARITDEQENGSFAELRVRAPQAGTIISHNVSAGQIAETTESLCTISDLSNLWVWCDVYEHDLAVLHEQFATDRSLQASIRVKAFASRTFDGVIDLIGNIMDEDTRTIKMRAQVKNPNNRLRPGLFAQVEVAIPSEEHMVVVPRTAVVSDAGQNFVFEHWKDSLWARRDVTLGSIQGDYAEILDGVPAGARIVSSGAFMLKSDVLREKMGAGCAD